MQQVIQRVQTGEEISWLCELQPAPANTRPRSSSLLQNLRWKVPSCSLAPYPKALLSEQPLEPSCGSGWGLSGCGGSTGEGDTLHPPSLTGWELPDMCSLRVSRPYRGAWRSSWAILSRVTRRPPGTWGSWRTRGAHGSISTLITLEEVHTDMVRRRGVGKGLVSGCPRHMHCIPGPPAPWPLLSQRNLTAASSWES